MKSLKKPNFAYIFTNNLDHPGLKLKYYGQLTAFRKKYTVTSVCFNWASSDWQLKKLALYLYFEWRSLIAIITSKTIYLRYNPKLFITNLLLPYFTSKTIYLEINTIFELELKLLNRSREKRANAFFMKHFKGVKHIIYVGVTKQIQQDMVDRYGVDQRCTRFIQNGYYSFDVNENNVDYDSVSQVKAFQKKFSKIGVFVGGGYKWHGINKLTEFASNYPAIGFIIVSSKEVPSCSNNVLILSKQDPATIQVLYTYSDFGISLFQPDVLGFKEFSSLKTREYLMNGLSVITTVFDCVQYISELSPFIFNINENPNVLDNIENLFKKDDIKSLAQYHLSWDRLLEDI
jgi:hypothetical protein